jgi:hypothetical protein
MPAQPIINKNKNYTPYIEFDVEQEDKGYEDEDHNYYNLGGDSYNYQEEVKRD